MQTLNIKFTLYIIYKSADFLFSDALNISATCHLLQKNHRKPLIYIFFEICSQVTVPRNTCRSDVFNVQSISFLRYHGVTGFVEN